MAGPTPTPTTPRPVRFDVSPDDAALITRIVRRAAEDYPGVFDRMDLSMDLTACHANGCPLDLAAFANGESFDFAHDVGGISQHMDRRTGQLRDCFLPRFAQRTPPQPELDFCSRCHEHADFTLLDGELVSTCCTARPVSVDVD
jgi:hypothetical protein